jgi:hypothetical protein
MESNSTRLNNPDYLALREIYQLPIVEHGYFLKTRHAGTEEEKEILRPSYHTEAILRVVSPV